MWRVKQTPSGLRVSPARRRQMGSERFTWAQLLYGNLGSVQVYVVYFPSRFDLDVDTIATDSLRSFGRNTGPATSVNFWDPQDPKFDKALELFDLKSPPALTLATGLKLEGIEPYGPNKAHLYLITITSREVLGDQERLASAVNTAHSVLVRGDPKEITGFIRRRAVRSLLEMIGRIANHLREEFLKFKPKIQLPDGTSVQVG